MTSSRTSSDLFAQALASEHAATLAVQQGNVALAEFHLRFCRMRRDLARDLAARECRFCNGFGAVPGPCPVDCAEHDEPRTGRHWEPCPSLTGHPTPEPPLAAPAPDRCPCNPNGTVGHHQGGPRCDVWEPAR
ncbi:hypothetical protein OG730_41880 (plasmid) [Streptomyces sp. NBC_01298]|uniref:hypothetical protein n=1 Tax=Streptomyces sp. NBC_01298 TaxID=2903817 RepID=UPI002E0E8266|nr:hypothetical protein OG730_41880 [Streptomyces sp. NBC_01298]